jgi:hypothetical protein
VRAYFRETAGKFLFLKNKKLEYKQELNFQKNKKKQTGARSIMVSLLAFTTMIDLSPADAMRSKARPRATAWCGTCCQERRCLSPQREREREE